jgi:hypothetical protein
MMRVLSARERLRAMERDSVLSNRILMCFNTLLAGSEPPIQTVRAAVVRFGLNTVTHMALRIENPVPRRCFRCEPLPARGRVAWGPRRAQVA